MPFLKPFMPQIHNVPGFRLGPDLPQGLVLVGLMVGAAVLAHHAGRPEAILPVMETGGGIQC